MESFFAQGEQAFREYRRDLEEYEKKRKPTDGLFGFGHSLQDDPCHGRADEKVRLAAEGLCAAQPSSDTAERMVRLLLLRDDMNTWPEAAQWMLRAMERHALPLIAFLSRDAAAAVGLEYAGRYRRWERLPVQKKICKALKEKSK